MSARKKVAPKPVVEERLVPIASVTVEKYDTYVNFKGCGKCDIAKNDKSHQHATCRCDCHKWPDRSISVVLECGHQKWVGRALDEEPPKAGELTHCLRAATCEWGR